MLPVILIPLCLMGYFFLIAQYSNVARAAIPAIIISMISMVLYVGGLLGVLQLTANTLLYVGIIAFIGTLMVVLIRDEYEHIVSKSALSYLAVLVVALTLTQIGTHYLHNWDEFGFWGLSVKSLFVYQKLPDTHSHIGFLDYPLGAPLFQYFIVNAFGAFKVNNVYLGQLILQMSLLFAITALRPWKVAAFAGVAMIFIVAIFDKYFPFYLYVDNSVSIAFAAILITYRFSRTQRIITLLTVLPLLCYLVLLKQVGLLLASVAIAIIVIDTLVHLKRNAEFSHNKKWQILLLLCVLPVAVMLTHIGWKHHYVNMGAHKSFATQSISTKNTISDIFNNTNVKAVETRQNFLHHFMYGGGLNRLGVSPAYSLLILLLLYIFIFVRLKSDNGARKDIVYEGLILLMGLLIYAIGLLILYIQAFGFQEAIRNASFGRYMAIYYLAWFFVVTAELISTLTLKKVRSSYGIGVAWVVTVVLLSINSFHAVKPLPEFALESKALNQLAKIPGNHTLQNTFIVLQDRFGFGGFAIKYITYPYAKPINPMNIAAHKHVPESSYLPEPQLRQRLKQYKYLYLIAVRRNFWQDYGALVPRVGRLPALYRIRHDGNKINLMPVG